MKHFSETVRPVTGEIHYKLSDIKLGVQADSVSHHLGSTLGNHRLEMAAGFILYHSYQAGAWVGVRESTILDLVKKEVDVLRRRKQTLWRYWIVCVLVLMLPALAVSSDLIEQKFAADRRMIWPWWNPYRHDSTRDLRAMITEMLNRNFLRYVSHDYGVGPEGVYEPTSELIATIRRKQIAL